MSARRPLRKTHASQDLGSIESISYNDAAGAKKMIIVEPVVVRAVAAGEAVGAGKLVKITGTTYTLDLLNRAYDVARTYNRGDVVSEGTAVYLCMQNNVTGTFDPTKWRKVADKVVGPVTVQAGAVVSTGRWHNTVSVAGFLVDDESYISYAQIRD